MGHSATHTKYLTKVTFDYYERYEDGTHDYEDEDDGMYIAFSYVFV